MTKYIVKNCPAFISKLFNWQQEEDNECLCTFSPDDVNSEMKKCKDRDDCPIKLIVNECKKYSYIFSERGILASLILQTLQVEDVE